MTTEVRAALENPERLEALEATGLLQTAPEEGFDRLTRLAVRFLGVEISFVSLLSAERQFLKSCIGLPEPWSTQRETPVEESFCQYAVARQEPLIITDAREHPLVRDNPVIQALDVVAYVGIPLITSDGHAVGTFCVADPEPRDWTDDEIRTLEDLAAGVTTELELRAETRRLAHAKEELRQSERLLRGIVDNVSDVLTILDADGTIRFESPSVQRMLGWKPEELEGRSALELVHPEDRERVARELGAAVRESGTVRVEEFRFRHRDGTWRYLEGAARSLPDNRHGHRVVASSRDVTDRRKMQERIRLLSTAVERTEEDIIITDPGLEDADPRIVYANPAVTTLTGYTSEEMVGATPAILHGPETDPDEIDRLREHLEADRPFAGSTIAYRKDGSELALYSSVAPVRDERGEVTHFVWVQRDITDELRYRERLEREVRIRTADLRQARQEVLDRLARAAEYRDDDTGEHTRRVASLVGMLARELGLPRQEARLLELAAPLHDLGKIGIPDAILLKPSRLSDAEFEVMRTHTVIGSELLAGGASELARTAQIIARSHHERWDGSGYPDGLTGEEIPLGARVVAVADAFDAMTHERPYKPAWSIDRAVEEIRTCAGNHFDPEVVEAFLAIRDRLPDLLGSARTTSPEPRARRSA